MTGLCHKRVFPPLSRRGKERRYPNFLQLPPGVSRQESREQMNHTRRTPPVHLPVCLSSRSPSLLPSHEAKPSSHTSPLSSFLSPSPSIRSHFTHFPQHGLHVKTSLPSTEEHQTFLRCLRRSASSSSSSLSFFPSSLALLFFPPRSSHSCLQIGKVRSFTRETGRASSGGQLAYRKKDKGQEKGDEEQEDFQAEKQRRRANIRSLLLRLKWNGMHSTHQRPVSGDAEKQKKRSPSFSCSSPSVSYSVDRERATRAGFTTTEERLIRPTRERNSEGEMREGARRSQKKIEEDENDWNSCLREIYFSLPYMKATEAAEAAYLIATRTRGEEAGRGEGETREENKDNEEGEQQDVPLELLRMLLIRVLSEDHIERHLTPLALHRFLRVSCLYPRAVDRGLLEDLSLKLSQRHWHMQVASLQLLIEDFSSCYRPGFLPFFEAVANRLASPATISSSTSLSHSLSERKGELHVLSYSGETGVEEQKRKERKKEQEEGGKERGQKNSGLSVSGRRNLDRGRQEEGDELTPLRACFFFNSYARTHCRHQDFFHRLANVLEKALEPLYYKAEQEKKRKREPTGEEGKKDINATIESSHHPLSIENRQKPVKPTTSMIRKDTRSEEEEEKGTTEGETTGQRLSSASCVSSSFSSSASSSLLKSSSSSTPELSHNDDGVVVPEGLTFGVLAVGLRGMVNCGYLPSDRLFTYASELLQQYVENPSASILYVRGEGLSVKHLFWALAFFCKARPPLSYSLSPSSPVQTTKPNIPSHLVFPVSSPYLLRTSSFLLRTLPQEAFKAADLNDLATAVRSFHDVLLSLLNNDVKRLNLILKKRKSTLKELERRGKEGGKGRRLREQLAAMSDDTPTMKGRGVAKSTAAHSSNNLEGERSLLRDGSSTSSCPSALFSSSQLDQDGKSSDLIKQIYLSEESTSILIDYLDSYLRLQDLLFTLLRRHLFGLHVSQRIYILEDISALSDVWPAHARRPSKSPELLLALQVGQRGTVSSSSLAPHTEKNNSSSDSVERETRKENRGEVFSEIPMNSATEVVDLAQPSTRSSVSSLPERQDIVVPSPSLRNQVKEEASSSSSQPMLLPTTSHLHILSKEESDQREELVPEQVELPPVVVALLQSIYYRLPPLCLRTLCRLLSALHTLGFTYEGRDTPTRTRFHCSPHRKDLTWSNPLLHVIGREGMRKASPATSEEMAEFLLRYYVDLECFDVCIEPLTFYIEKFACLHASRPLSPPVLEALGVVLQTVMRDHRYAVECLEDLPDFTRSFIRQICPSYRPETMNSARMDEHQQSVFKSKSSLVVAYENREFFFPTSSRRLSSPLLSR